MDLRAIFIFLGLAALMRATTVEPPTFPELVAGADAVYRGHVTAVQARRIERPGGGMIIKTFVTFAVDRALKGAAQDEVVLEFLGGRVGDDIMEVSGVPQFEVGDREFVFVQGNQKQFCPLVAVMHGRYRIAHDEAAGRDYVARDNRLPLTDVAEVSQPMDHDRATARSVADISRALTPATFESLISAEVRAPTVQSPPR
jgi:hypothetical protein